MCGVNIGLCLPRMIFATSDARRPSTSPSASTTNQRCSMSDGVAEYVFMRVGIECASLGNTDSQATQALRLCQREGDRRVSGCAAAARGGPGPSLNDQGR